SAALSDDWLAPSFVASYQAGAQNLIYLSLARGYGSPGVYPVGTEDEGPAQVYPADCVWSYELGSKHSLLDGRAHLDFSLFHADWNNGTPQENSLRGEWSATPGAAASDGFGISAQALLREHLQATVAVAYANTRHTETLKSGNVVLIQGGDKVIGSNN